ncbi:MAG: nucleoside-diphosphate kinase [Bacteroidales bacterium]
MENTLLLIKPSAVQRGLIGEIIHRIERKGLKIVGLKMIQLTDEILDEHYAHLRQKSFFEKVKSSMKATPVIAMCIEGMDSVAVVRSMTGATNGRIAAPGTLRGDLCVSISENVVHTSESSEAAAVELNRFFSPEEIFSYPSSTHAFTYSSDEF